MYRASEKIASWDCRLRLFFSFRKMKYSLTISAFTLLISATLGGALPVFLPPAAFGPAQVGVVINDADPQSVTVGLAYQGARTIPPRNVVHLNFSTGQVLSREEFFSVYATLSSALPSGIQALALTWLWPYRVDCMSVTSAFAFNFSEKYCGNYPPCNPTAPSPYYNSTSQAPFDDFGIRPTFLIAGWTAADALATIAAGVTSGT